MKYLFIVNPVAGTHDAVETVIPQIHRALDSTDADFSIEITEHPGHARELAHAAAQSGEQIRICACGGDGTLCEVINGAYGYDNVELACYPCGSGNDFIRCFGDAEQFRDITSVVSGSAKRLDALRVNGDTVCFNLLSVGIDADVNYGAGRWRRFPLFRGRISYDLSLFSCLLKSLGKHLRLDIGGEVREGDFLLCAVGNGRVYGGGYIAAPEAKADDGLIDVVTVKKIPLTRIVKVLDKYKHGEHIINGEVIEELRDCMTFNCVQSMSISSDKEFVLNIDGESIKTTSAEVTMLPASWNFVVPESCIEKTKA